MKKTACIILSICLVTLVATQCQTNPFRRDSFAEKNTPTTTNSINQDAPNPASGSSIPKLNIEGNLLKAFLIAHEAFTKDKQIPTRKRQVENYEVEIYQDEVTYTVHFIPHALPVEGNLAGGETELGVEVSYTVRKNDFTMVAQDFYR